VRLFCARAHFCGEGWSWLHKGALSLWDFHDLCAALIRSFATRLLACFTLQRRWHSPFYPFPQKRISNTEGRPSRYRLLFVDSSTK
jgi:hypothetical protein